MQNKPKSPQILTNKDNKRNHSCLSNSEKSSPKMLQHVNKNYSIIIDSSY
jgi:hypothetical protein